MRRQAEHSTSKRNRPARDWAQIGTGVLDAARLASALHMAKAAERIGGRDAVEESPRVQLGG